MLSPSRLIGLALLFLGLPAGARTLEVGPGKQFAQPSQAAVAAQDGDRIVIAPGQYFDCAVWRQNNLTVEGVSPQETVITDKICQGKALFVISGSNVTVPRIRATPSHCVGNLTPARTSGGAASCVGPRRTIPGSTEVMSVI